MGEKDNTRYRLYQMSRSAGERRDHGKEGTGLERNDHLEDRSSEPRGRGASRAGKSTK